MAYGLKYICEFTGGPNGLEPYSVELWFKDWTGTFYNIVGGSSPVTHGWDKDEPKPGVKGSSIDMQFINPGNLPLSAFYGTDDDNCLVIYKWDSQVLFTGYLVQDDCSEIMVDFTHYINLTATDNLGLLKGVSLLDAARLWGAKTTLTTYINRVGNYIVSVTEGPGTFPVAPGDSITILITDPDGVPYNGTYLVEQVVVTGGVLTEMQVATFISLPLGFGLGFTGSVTLAKPVDLTARLSLAAIIRLCLLSTNLTLNCDVYANIIETSTTTARFLEETFEGGNDYSTGNNDWKKCYDVLTIILERFNATLFQAEGVWNIVRWDELRYYNNEVTGFRYDSEMVYSSDIIQQDIFTTGFEQVTYPVTGPNKSILGAFKFDKETFNYKQNTGILNYTLQDVGPLISSSTSGTIRTDNYEFPAWSRWLHVYGDESYIVVKTEILPFTEIEKERYVYQPKINNGLPPGYENFLNVQFNDIEVQEGDAFDFECSIKTASSTGGDGVYYRFGFFLQTTTGQYYNLVNQYGPGFDMFKWNLFNLTPIQSIGNPLLVLAEDAESYTAYKLSDTGAQKRVPRFPASGLLRIRMYGTNDTNVSQPNVDCIWNNIRFTFYALINDTTQITGQTHTNTQNQNPKANEDVEIFIDDSPRNSIQGTLFLSTFTGLLQDRTTLWMRPTVIEARRLGDITTFEQLFWRRIPRTKLEGQMYGVVQNINRTLRYTLTGSVGEVDIVTGLYKVISASLPAGIFTAGVVFTLSGTGGNDGTYTVDSVIDATTFLVEEVMPAGLYTGSFTLTLDAIQPRHISMLTIINYVGLSGLNFIFGRLTIDPARNNFNGTFWEQWQAGEIDSDIRNYYEFKYLYETK